MCGGGATVRRDRGRKRRGKTLLHAWVPIFYEPAHAPFPLVFVCLPHAHSRSEKCAIQLAVLRQNKLSRRKFRFPTSTVRYSRWEKMFSREASRLIKAASFLSSCVPVVCVRSTGACQYPHEEISSDSVRCSNEACQLSSGSANTLVCVKKVIVPCARNVYDIARLLRPQEKKTRLLHTFLFMHSSGNIIFY